MEDWPDHSDEEMLLADSSLLLCVVRVFLLIFVDMFSDSLQEVQITMLKIITKFMKQ